MRGFCRKEGERFAKSCLQLTLKSKDEIPSVKRYLQNPPDNPGP